MLIRFVAQAGEVEEIGWQHLGAGENSTKKSHLAADRV